MSFSFQIHGDCPETSARRGSFATAHGEVQTPIFMPVGTLGTVKGITPKVLKDELAAQIILGNTYHLYLRPGHELIKKAGGLHKFMNWDGPILTDSGGFQVFSLAKLRKITEEGVQFQSHIDGSRHFLTPELSIEIQEALGSDIMMVFDECPPYPCDRDQMEKSLKITHAWEARSLAAKTRTDNSLFAIIQGGVYHDLRKQSLAEILELEEKEKQKSGKEFQGYAVGGLSVGEPNELMYETLAELEPHMPKNKPRYLMGVGTPEDLLTCIGLGVDMFDCVMPTRNARNGMFITEKGNIKIKQARFLEDFEPVDADCECYTCQNFSRAYLRHLYVNNEILSAILATIHNLHYYLRLLENSRLALENGTFQEFQKQSLSRRKEFS